MTHLFTRAALSLAIAAPAALAMATEDSPPPTAAVRHAFGNTIVETYGDGRKAEIWLKADGSYTAEGRRHDRSNGQWSVSGDQLCFKQAHPFVFGARFCTPIPKVGLGEPWQAKAATGEAITVKVEPGHVVPD
jgi:hypothetical protein